MFKFLGKCLFAAVLIMVVRNIAMADSASAPLPNIVIPEVQKPFPHYRYKFDLTGKPAVVNVIILEEESPYGAKLFYGSHDMRKLNFVKDLSLYGCAAVNAQYFKGDGTPLGLSIVNGKLITGPLYKRTVFGVTEDEEYKIGEVELNGQVRISRDNLPITNINQPILSSSGVYIYNNIWGCATPETSSEYYHLVVKRGRIKTVATGSVQIPPNSYVVVFNKNQLPRLVSERERVKYKYKLTPDDWNDMEYAVAAGPVLVRDGQKFIPNQNFQRDIFIGKAPRTAIGFTKDNKLIIMTVDGRQKGISEGATLSELADLMLKFGAYQAMNLDGGSSTQMAVGGRLVNCPSRSVRVTNGILIYKK